MNKSEFTPQQIEAKIWAWQNQKILTFIANLDEGKDLLQLPREFWNYKVAKVTPNSLHFLLGEEKGIRYMKSIHWLNYQVAEKLQAVVSKMDLAWLESNKYKQKILEQPDEAFRYYAGYSVHNKLYLPQYYLLNDVDYVTSGRGCVYFDGGGTWAAARTGAGTATIGATQFRAQTYAGGQQIRRLFFPADTSGIGAGAVVSAWNFHFYINALGTNSPTITTHLVVTTQASTSSIVVGDYNNFINTSIGSLAKASMANTAYNVIAGTDLAAIIVDGISKIGSIESPDLLNAEPANGDNATGFHDFGEANPPYYDVTYTTGSASASASQSPSASESKSLSPSASGSASASASSSPSVSLSPSASASASPSPATYTAKYTEVVGNTYTAKYKEYDELPD